MNTLQGGLALWTYVFFFGTLMCMLDDDEINPFLGGFILATATTGFITFVWTIYLGWMFVYNWLGTVGG